MAALALRLRDNADRLWLISQGWAPSEDYRGNALDVLLAETIAVAEEMARQEHAPGDGTRDGSPPGSLD